MGLPGTLRRLLRSPRTIVAEVALVALAGVASTVVPQGTALSARMRFAEEHPLLAPLARALGLDHVFQAPWFLALVALAGASLSIVLVEQWRRLFREWRAVPSEAAFRSAPLRAEFTRPARGARSRVAVRHRAGLVGSPLFHLGLMVVILAGVGRMLFGADAAVNLYEGEVLAARADAFGAQWTGPLARPVVLRAPVAVREIAIRRYASGQLEGLSARLEVREPGGPPRPELLAVNAPLDLGAERLYLTTEHGCAALLELDGPAGAERRAVLLDEVEPREYGRSEVFPGGLKVRLRARATPAGGRPEALEVRVLREGALLGGGTLSPGQALDLPGVGRLALHGLRTWARFVGARDLSAWPAYLGFGLALAGAVLMFTVVKVDVAVLVRPAGADELVTVALRPQRLAPLYREELSRLVREEGGSGPG
jgi:hypothetical protein